MIIIGAKGFAKEVLELLHQHGNITNLAFFDDVSTELPHLLFGQFPILKSEKEVRAHFSKCGPSFFLGIGNPALRKILSDKFLGWGGELNSVISKTAEIGHFNVNIGKGCNILPLSVIANDTTLGKGCIVYYNVLVTHDCIVGDFVELSPGATLLGKSQIGSYTQIGANATVLPGVQIGKNSIIGAGAVVTKDIPDNVIATGVPAKIIRSKNEPE